MWTGASGCGSIAAVADSPSFTEMLIQRAIDKFAAPRRETKVFAGGRGMTVHRPGERVLHLPNGATVKVTVDDSGVATQVEEDEHLHAIVRPPTFHYKIGRDR